MHKVKTPRSGELLVKNMLIFYFFSMVIIKKLLSEKILKKLPEIFGKIKINFRKFSE